MPALAADDRENAVTPPDAVSADTALLWAPSVYAPPPGTKSRALAMTLLIFACVIGGAIIGWTRSSYIVPKQAAPLVVSLLPLASPPAQKHEEETPVPRKKREKQLMTPRVETAPKAAVPLPSEVPAPPPVPTTPAPVPAPAAESAPKAMPAPPAPQVSSNTPDTSWQGRVLARLDQYRRYPTGAQGRREQGVPYIRFVMDRDGKILSSRLERSSGFPDLDREAVTLPKRSQPLPKPPADVVGDTIELVVPVEFFIY